MGSRRKVLIVFPDEWYSYSPTILNILTLFGNYNYVVFVYCDNGLFKNSEIKNSNIEVVKVKINSFLSKILGKLRLYKFYKVLKLILHLYKIKNKYKEFDTIIGIDEVGFITTKLVFGDSIFLSLEISKGILLRLCKILGIKKLVIQSKERAEYLELAKDTLVEYLPNSPIVENFFTPKTKKFANPKKLLYFGNIIKEHGVEVCIEALKLLDECYTLTLKGIPKTQDKYLDELIQKYKDLINQGRLIIDLNYIEQNDVLSYIREYYIGFCLYDFRIINEKNFNYASSPSGKVFNYIATGTPVICNDILAFKFTKDNNCGVVIKELHPVNIVKAIKEIDLNYEIYSKKCIEVFKDFEFSRRFKEIFNIQITSK